MFCWEGCQYFQPSLLSGTQNQLWNSLAALFLKLLSEKCIQSYTNVCVLHTLASYFESSFIPPFDQRGNEKGKIILNIGCFQVAPVRWALLTLNENGVERLVHGLGLHVR